MLVFMDQNTYEQISLSSDLIGEARPFLQDGNAGEARVVGRKAYQC